MCSPDGDVTGSCWGSGGVVGVEPFFAAQAASLYFTAYLAPVTRGKGQPDESILGDALSVPLEAGTHAELQFAIFTSLKYVLGFDFGGIDPGGIVGGGGGGCGGAGNIFGVGGGGFDGLRAARRRSG